MALAKTARPALASTLVRPRLFRRLDRARAGPASWVWGPPGAGKTTLVASYVVARRLRGLWYQIDEADADVATFFYYLGQAAPRRRRPLPLLTPEYRHGLTVFAQRFFRELYARLTSPFALVFDNYQEAPATSPLHEVMREAVGEIPPGGHVIFISRAEPLAAFARLRTQRAMEMLDWSQLRLTHAEATGLVRRLAPGRWSRQTIRSLHESADGWCAGLVLLLDQFRREGRTALGPGRASSEVLFDYFAGEIFKKADAETREVLLQTAHLPRVTASMAAALTGRPEAGQILAQLHRQNYFTNRTAGAEPVYEYHPLFREFLRSQADRAYPPTRRAEIRRAAAGLVEVAGQVEAAAGLLRDAEDWEGLVGLICRHAPTLLAQGRGQAVEGWLASLPEAALAANPWLLYWRGLCWFGWRHAESQRDFEQAFLAFRRQRDTTGMFSAWSALIIAYQGEGNSLAVDPWITLLDELLQENPEFPSEEVEMRVAGAMLSAIHLRRPRHPEGGRWAERALELARRHPDLGFRGITALNWFLYHWQLGDLARAALVVDEMRALMRARDVSPVVAINASMAVVWHESLSALPSYRRTVSEVLELARTTGMFYASKQASLIAGLFAALSDGDLETAHAWLRDFEKDLPIFGTGFHAWYHMFVVREALLRGDLERAATRRPEMVRLSLACGWPMHYGAACLVSAQVLHERGEAGAAQADLAQALEIADAMESPYVEFMARLTEAQLQLDSGREAEGLRALGVALHLGKAGGFVNTHVWQPAVMARLCARALEAGIEVEYVQGLIRRRRLVPDSPPVEVEAWPWPVKVYTLGRFSVLRDGEPLRFAGKVQRKPLALLKAVVALGGRGVREDSVTDALWPEAEGDAARLALTSTIHRLRRLLGHEEAIVRKDDALSLDGRHCWVDVWALERLLDRAEGAAARRAGDAGARAEAIGATERAVELYQGSFLGGEADTPWATPLADRLRRRLLRQVMQVGLHWEGTGEWQKAADYYATALRVDPCAEDASRRLMIACHHLGRAAEVEAAYRRCREALAARLGVTPSPETQSLLRSLHAG